MYTKENIVLARDVYLLVYNLPPMYKNNNKYTKLVLDFIWLIEILSIMILHVIIII